MEPETSKFLGLDGIPVILAAARGLVGDGLSKEGDTLSVTTPVRGIVTQAEFDALTEAQKNSGLYVISDGGGGGSGGGESAGEVYSTEETRIGTWIDGKPLYRKTLVLKASTSTGPLYYDNDIFDVAVCTVCDIRGTVFTENGRIYALNSMTGAAYVVSMIQNGKLCVEHNHKTFANATVYETLEYTKTTDE